MGNIPGMPDFPADAIQEIAQNVMGTFTPIYVKQYAVGLIEKLTEEKEPKKKPDWQLTKRPKPHDILLEGWGTKQGAVRASWKKRYFVAMNQADNYIIYYYKSDKDKENPEKATGKISICGLKPVLLQKEEDVEKYGEHCIQLKPRNRRRNWFIRFDSKEEMDTWFAVFEYASKKAKAPLNKDKVMREAFLAAYTRTRWSLWIWSWWRADCTEEEMLSQLIVDRCERDVMHDVYAKIHVGKLHNKIHKEVQNVLDKTVGAVVSAGWKGCTATIDSQKVTLENSARELLDPVLEKKAEFLVKIKDAIVGTLSPILEEISKPVITPVMEKIQSPVFNMYEVGIRTFHEQMSEIIAGGMKPKAVSKFLKETSYYWGPLRPAYKKIRDLTRSDAMEILSDILYEVRWWHIEDMFEDRLRKLTNRAVFTFCSELENGRSDTGVVLKETLMKFSHDAQIAGVLDVVSIFEKIIMPPFRQKVIPAVKDIISPISELIPDAVKTFLDPDKLVEQIMNDSVKEIIHNLVAGSSRSTLAKLDDVAAKLG